MIFNSRLSVKIFNNLGIIVTVYLIFVIKKNDMNIKNTIITLSMLLLCAVNFIWELMYRVDNSDVSGVYRAYYNVDKILLLGSMYILLAIQLSTKNKITKPLFTAIHIVPSILLLYFYFTPDNGRFTLSDGIPTTSGYMMTFIGIVIAQATLLKKTAKRVNLFLLNYAIFFILIILTETRAAILAFPLLNIILLYPFIKNEKKIDFNLIKKFVIVSITCLILCHNTINTRANNMFSDLKRYDSSDSHSSVGARIAMYKTGIVSFLDAPWGQSAESRAISIQQQTEKDSSLSGASQYTEVHLHNEFIETLSLKGIFGGVALFIFYVSLIYVSLFFIKDYAVISLSLSLMIYGLSDVIFYEKNISIVWILTYCLSIVLAKSKNEKSLTSTADSK
ncbi:hypothetical protein AWC36_19645 [Brenneria goodwinii]|nr:hypothetical protein AWC36_19645 [Brenneria goodwinii]